ncbi:hypothetical protein BAL199_09268 [alpha proteobacterium BAL199]|nr:hypothetical protein BAL199_09268 [alpha proteobacterium BAL199]
MNSAAQDDRSRLDPSTHFIFQHRIFKLPDARFEVSGRDRAPVLRVKLGELDAVIPIDDVSSEFGIKPDAQDGKLLVQVAQGLRFIRDIRPGDSIPSELLDGTASWRVEDHHREIAKNRLMMQVATWLGGSESVVLDLRELRRMSVDASIQDKIREGITQIAGTLGLGANRRDEVLDMIDRFARELCYIEALRDRYNLAGSIGDKLGRVAKLYRDEKQFHEEVRRAQILFRPAVSGFTGLFDQVDAQTSEIIAVLKGYDSMVKFVREMRDELHQRLIIWDTIIPAWNVNLERRHDEIREAVRATYRFVAFHFPQTHDWL